MSLEINKIYNEDCIIGMKKLDANSVDSIVTDPPYELGFMGKSWDNSGIAYNKEMWKEALRVLKPGGHLLSFGGTRTYHRMACAIEDAGFEIRDQMQWIYGSGFPKSLNVSLNISKGIDNFINSLDINYIWKNINLINVLCVEKRFQKNIIETGMNIEKRNSVVENVLGNLLEQKRKLNVKIVENCFIDSEVILNNTYIVVENVEQKIQILEQNVKFVIKKLLNEEVKLKTQNIFIVECNVKELLNEKIQEIIKDEEVQKTWLGKIAYSKSQDINAICVELIESLKHIISNQLKNFLNLDMTLQMDYVFAINVIITKSTMECLILFMEDILKKLNNKYKGWGTALKPAHEPIVVARKPLEEKTVAENVLKYGTGGINIDDCRIDVDLNNEGSNAKRIDKTYNGKSAIWNNANKSTTFDGYSKGRFPSNIIHNGSEEVLKEFAKAGECGAFAPVKSGQKEWGGNIYHKFKTSGDNGKTFYKDGLGTPARFFKQCNYIEDDLIWLNENIFVNNVAKSFGIMNVTERIVLITSVLKNVLPFIDSVKNCLNVLSVGKQLKSTEINVVQEFVQILTNGGQELIILKQIFQKKEDLELMQLHNIIIGLNNLVLSVEKQRPLKDTIQIIQNLKVLFGYVVPAICEFTMVRFKYQAKASKSERNQGLEGFKDKQKIYNGQSDISSKDMKDVEKRFTPKPIKNNHPTVKSLKLLEYLVKLVTPKGGVVLDPFIGSGTTGVAAKSQGFNYIGFDMTKEYCEIAEARIKSVVVNIKLDKYF